jgi:hypothetical protein
VTLDARTELAARFVEAICGRENQFGSAAAIVGFSLTAADALLSASSPPERTKKEGEAVTWVLVADDNGGVSFLDGPSLGEIPAEKFSGEPYPWPKRLRETVLRGRKQVTLRVTVTEDRDDG